MYRKVPGRKKRKKCLDATVDNIKMDGNTIVDGNHRMVAGLLCNQIPASTPGTALLSKPRIPLKDIQPDPIDWW